MRTTKQRLQALGTSTLAIIGLLMLMAHGAHANWLVGGAELKTNESVAVGPHTVWGLQDKALNIEIQCTSAASSGFKLVASSATAEGEIKRSGCVTISPIGSGTVQSNCKPVEPITFGLKILIILHNGKNYLLLEPAKSGIISVIQFPEICALAETSELTGSRVDECGHLASPPPDTWVFLDCNSGGPTYLIRPASRLLFLELFKLGENEVEETGIVSLKLSGANAGKSWAIHV